MLQHEKLNLYETQRELIQKIDGHKEELKVLIDQNQRNAREKVIFGL